MAEPSRAEPRPHRTPRYAAAGMMSSPRPGQWRGATSRGSPTPSIQTRVGRGGGNDADGPLSQAWPCLWMVGGFPEWGHEWGHEWGARALHGDPRGWGSRIPALGGVGGVGSPGLEQEGSCTPAERPQVVG